MVTTKSPPIPEFDYKPYEAEIITAERVDKLINVVASPDTASVWGMIRAAIQIVLIAAGMYVMWHLRQRDRRKHKQKYEIKTINDNKIGINSDNLD